MSYENIPKNAGETAVLVEITSPIETSVRGNVGLKVYVQDQTTDMLDLRFTQTKVTGLTLGAATVLDSRVVQLSGGHGLTTGNSAGHVLDLDSNSSGHFFRSRIISVSGNNVTVSSPMTRVFTPGGTLVKTGNPNLARDEASGVAIDGSSTPVIFRVAPNAYQKGDVTRMLIAITSDNAMDLTTLGGAAELAIGMVLRVKLSDGTYKNLYTYHNNFDFSLHGYNVTSFTPKAGNLTQGLLAMVEFAGQGNHGVAVRLDGSLGEELQLVVQDLMLIGGSGNLSIGVTAQGSELQD